MYTCHKSGVCSEDLCFVLEGYNIFGYIQANPVSLLALLTMFYVPNLVMLYSISYYSIRLAARLHHSSFTMFCFNMLKFCLQIYNTFVSSTCTDLQVIFISL
jgi:hypothetical protein